MIPSTRVRCGPYRRAAEWFVIALGAAVLLLACAPDQRHKLMTALFDGVPGDQTPSPERSRAVTPASAQRFAQLVSHGHHSFAQRCENCHIEQTMVASDTKCIACHPLQPHNPGEKVEMSGAHCAACHREHGGAWADLTAVSSERCTMCHRFEPFESAHPPFALTEAEPEDVEEAKYATGLEVFHAVHVKQTVQGADRTLDCIDCHHPDATGSSFVAPNFDEHCGACHTAVQLHKVLSPPEWPAIREKVKGGADAELLLLSDARWRTAEAALEKSAEDASDEQQETLEEALESLREARDELKEWDSQSCLQCHTLVEKKVGDKMAVTVAPVRYRSGWFEKTRFSHQAHAYLACNHCHQVPESAAAELGRLMLPAITTCTACHHEGGATTSCSMCHLYHDRTPIAPFGAHEQRAIELLNLDRP